MELSKERLEALSNLGSLECMALPASHAEVAEMARRLLAAEEQQPVAWTDAEELRDLARVGFAEMFSVEPVSVDADPLRVIPLYLHPQQGKAVQVPDELLSTMEEVLRISDRDHEHWHKAKEGIAAFRAAMLTSEPVSNRDELPEEVQRACSKPKKTSLSGFRKGSRYSIRHTLRMKRATLR